MKSFKTKRISLLLLFIATSLWANAQINIVSGVKGGSYEQFAIEMSKISTHPIQITSSNGSVENFNKLMDDPNVDVTFLQEDVLYHQQADDLEKGIDRIGGVRILVPLGYEEIHIVARASDKSINKITDLEGKIVATGNNTQGTSITAKLVKEKTKIKWTDVSKKLILDSVLIDLTNGDIDAFFFVGAAPVAALANRNDIKLIAADAEILKEIYYKSTVKEVDYKCLKSDYTTYAVKSVLATNVLNETEDHKRKIDFLLSDLKNNLPRLKKSGHKKWKDVDLNYENLDWEPYESAEAIFFPEKGLSADIVLLSGILGGSYYEFANNIQGIAGQDIKVLTSHGSSENLKRLIDRDEIFITFLQYDVLVKQKRKDEEENTDYTDNIKLILPLGKEEIHLITRKDSKIKSIRGLRGKKVSIGTTEQGSYVTANLIKEETNAKWIDVLLPFDKAYVSLLNNEIDAFFFVGSAPISAFSTLPADANIKLIPIKRRRLEKIYVKSEFPASTYPWMDGAVKTFAVKSVLATNTKDETIAQGYNLTKLLMDINDNIEKLKRSGHPKWKEVNFNFESFEWPVYKGAKEVFNK